MAVRFKTLCDIRLKGENTDTAQECPRADEENRFDVKTTSDKEIVSENKSVSTTSDIMMLQNFKLLQYVSAERLGPKNNSAKIDSLDNNRLGVKGEYVINVLSNQGSLFQEKVCDVL